MQEQQEHPLADGVSDMPAKQPEAIQPDFFDDGSEGVELATIDKPEAAKRYTGEQLEARTFLRDIVVRLLAEGVGIRLIAMSLRQRGYRIGERSIMALRDRRPELVAVEKKQLSTQLGRIGKLMADSIETRLVEGTMKPTSVDLAIVIDKKTGLDGEANLVIEHRHTHASADDFIAKLEAMKRAKVAQAPKTAPIDCASTVETQKP